MFQRWRPSWSMEGARCTCVVEKGSDSTCACSSHSQPMGVVVMGCVFLAILYVYLEDLRRTTRARPTQQLWFGRNLPYRIHPTLFPLGAICLISTCPSRAVGHQGTHDLNVSPDGISAGSASVNGRAVSMRSIRLAVEIMLGRTPAAARTRCRGGAWAHRSSAFCRRALPAVGHISSKAYTPDRHRLDKGLHVRVQGATHPHSQWEEGLGSGRNAPQGHSVTYMYVGEHQECCSTVFMSSSTSRA